MLQHISSQTELKSDGIESFCVHYLQSVCNLWPSCVFPAAAPWWSYTGGRNPFSIHSQWWRLSRHPVFGWTGERCRGPGRHEQRRWPKLQKKTKHTSQSDSGGVSPHVDPDVAGLLVDDEGLRIFSESLQGLLVAGLILAWRNEKCWRQ